jgi:hypothetical protein
VVIIIIILIGLRLKRVLVVTYVLMGEGKVGDCAFREVVEHVK